MLKFFCTLLLVGSCHATTIDTCFTPGDDCTQQIVSAINNAKTAIEVQAYSFTSLPIAQALVHASNTGIDVKVILDKINFGKEPSPCEKLLEINGIPIWDDYQPDIAHNKIIIIDGEKVITGSFNLTNAAQFKNAENIVIIDDVATARAYIDNWISRKKASKAVGE